MNASHKMKESLIILITGLSCTGKTTFAKQVAESLDLPLLSKDVIKESLFDSLGIKDREWSKQLGIASIKLHFEQMEELLRAGVSLIAENDYKPEFDTEQFATFQAQYGTRILQFQFVTDGAILFERFKKRSESGERHPGHVDHNNYDEFQETLLAGRRGDLRIDGDTIEVDTTDFATVDYEGLLEQIKKELEGSMK